MPIILYHFNCAIYRVVNCVYTSGGQSTPVYCKCSLDWLSPLARIFRHRFNMESNEQISYTRNTDKVFEVFQSLRNDDFLCDVILKADNGYTVNAHKVVLAAACPYFLAMFSHFKEREKKHIIIKELDPTALKILINYMYTGQILVTEENVQILLAGSTLLQLHSIQEVCCDLLKRILHPTNCSDIWTLADLYSCQEFLPICESYIKQHFSEVVKSDEFLSLSFDQFFKLISSDELTIFSEEIVLKCVVKWVNHLPSSRKDVLPKLIAQIRFLLMSKECLFEALDEPIIKNSPDCQGLIYEALYIYYFKLKGSLSILKTISSKRRRFGLRKGNRKIDTVAWIFPTNSLLQPCSEMRKPRFGSGLAVFEDSLVLAVGGYDYLPIPCINQYHSPLHTLNILPFTLLSGPHWVQSTPMISGRAFLGVAVLDKCFYAVGGCGLNGIGLNTAEVFDCLTHKWKMISNMSVNRFMFGIGKINNNIYVVGGLRGTYKQNVCLNSVECYHPGYDIWTQVACMSKHREKAGVGILDGVMYAVGGRDESEFHKSVEAYCPSTGVWTFIADMHIRRANPSVFSLNGLLLVMGGYNDETSNEEFLEIYNPKTNTWKINNEPAVNNAYRLVGIACIIT